MNELNQTIQRLEDYVLAQHALENPGYVHFEYQGETRKGYPYQRLNHVAFAKSLQTGLEHLASRETPFRFLDVGCGIGTKVSIARSIGFEASGIDISADYIRVAEEVFPDCQFQVANALEFDYQSFDVIYLYVPLADRELMTQLESRIIGQIASGSLIIAPRFTGQTTRERIVESKEAEGMARWMGPQDGTLKLIKKN